MIPKIFKEIRNIIPVRNVGEVPRIAERVLTKIESLSALMKNDEASLSADIVQAIFLCLHLSTEEKKQVLHYLKANVKFSITEIREYIFNRFQEYEAMINALGPPPKQKFELKPPRPAEITAGAAITDGSGEGAGQGGRGAGSGRGGWGRRGGRSKWPNKVDPLGGNTGIFLPEKKKKRKTALAASLLSILCCPEKATKYSSPDRLSLDHCSQQI